MSRCGIVATSSNLPMGICSHDVGSRTEDRAWGSFRQPLTLSRTLSKRALLRSSWTGTVETGDRPRLLHKNRTAHSDSEISKRGLGSVRSQLEVAADAVEAPEYSMLLEVRKLHFSACTPFLGIPAEAAIGAVFGCAAGAITECPTERVSQTHTNPAGQIFPSVP